MSGTVQVLLLEDIAGKGKAGDIISVTEGYARNALFPEGKAALATSEVKKSKTQEDERQQAEEKRKLAALQEIAAKLEGTELRITVTVKDESSMFGSITARNIADELKNQAGLDVKPAAILLDEPIRVIGNYDVTVALSPDVECRLKLVIEADEEAS